MSADEAKPITWDDVRALYDKLSESLPTSRHTWIITPEKWADLINGATPTEEARLLVMRGRGEIVVSDYLPGDFAYLFDRNPEQQEERGEK